MSWLAALLGAQMVKNLPAMLETQVQSLGQEDAPEEGMATHSSILAWRIPWTEEPGGPMDRVANSQTQLNDEHFHSQECSACVSSLSPFTERGRAWVCLPQFTWESGLTLATRLVNTEGLSASFVFRFHT